MWCDRTRGRAVTGAWGPAPAWCQRRSLGGMQSAESVWAQRVRGIDLLCQLSQGRAGSWGPGCSLREREQE